VGLACRISEHSEAAEPWHRRPRNPDYEWSALPTELRRRMSCKSALRSSAGAPGWSPVGPPVGPPGTANQPRTGAWAQPLALPRSPRAVTWP